MRKQAVILFAMTFLMSIAAMAQLTVLNIPSGDTAGAGHVYLRLDTFVNPHTTRQTAHTVGTNPFATMTPNVIYGVTDKLDVGLNASTFTIGTNSQASLVPNFKYKILDPKGEGFGAYFGDQVYAPLGHEVFGAGNMAYAAGFFQVEGLGRLTAGAYNGQNLFARGNRTGAMVSVEHWFSDQFVGAADWMSGRNAQSTVGLMYYPKHFSGKLMIIPAYAFGNSGARNNGMTVYLGYDLGKIGRK